MKDYWEEPVEKKLNKKKLAIAVLVIVILIILITGAIVYLNNKTAREWIDKNIFQKEISQNNLPSIDIKEDNDLKICAFNKYIGILNKNNFEIYDNIGKKLNSLSLEISKPIFDSNNRYLVVAEEKGQKLYLIADRDILWEKKIEGHISQVTINKNGYVAVTIVDTSYKTVIEMYDSQGEQLFIFYLSSNRVVATSISEDNKYLAFAEIDTSGTMIQSNIKIVSIEDAKNKSNDYIKKVYNGQNDQLLTNIKYQDKNKLLCMYTDKITEIKTDETVETIQEYSNKKISFASINLSNSAITIEERSSGIFTADSVINITNSENKNLLTYTVESVIKEIYTHNNIIALNLGSEVEFINTNGWLVKRYTAEQEITSIVLSNSVAGIVYRDKIEIINL